VTRVARALLPFIQATETVKLVTTVKIERKDWNDQSFTTEGDNMNVSLTVDDQNVAINVIPEDDQGNATGDVLTFSSDDATGALLSSSVAGNVWTGVVEKKEGVVNLTVTDPSSPNLPPTIIAITLGAGATSQLVASAVVTNPDGTTTPVASS
jgi:hypothetical protein